MFLCIIQSILTKGADNDLPALAGQNCGLAFPSDLKAHPSSLLIKLVGSLRQLGQRQQQWLHQWQSGFPRGGRSTVASLVPWHLQLHPPSQSNRGKWHPPAEMFQSWLIRGDRAGLGWEGWWASFLSHWPLASHFPAAASCRSTNAEVPDGPGCGQTRAQSRASPRVFWKGNRIRSARGFSQLLGGKEKVWYKREGQNGS